MLVEKALNDNSIRCVNASSQKVKFQKALDTFKRVVHSERGANSVDQNCNVLLLAVRNGSRGLNLIEATHVIMVDPLLNSGTNWQTQ
jgi:E3 ubiquitin-protein ligase SHPRH